MLRLTSKEGIHGLQSDDLGIPLTTITTGSTTSLNVTPKKTGKYVLHCAIMCGAGHANMTLTVNVVQ
jgi:cytochrome c oxidase subunit 2